MEGAPTPCVATHLLARCTTNEKRDKGKMGLRGKVKKGELTSEGRQVLERCRFRGSSGDDDGVLHGVVLLEGLDKLSDGGSLLADGNVDTVELLGLVGSVVPSLLVQDGIEGNSSLSGLTVTNDQLTLTTSDGHHGIDGLETSLNWLVDGLSGQDTGGLQLGTTLLGGLDGPLTIDGVSKGVNDTAKHLETDRNIDLVFNKYCPSAHISVSLTISPVRLTVSPSLTRRSEPKSTTPTCPASRFMHIPLTPEANLYIDESR